jgi:hypothetical protein
MCPLCISTVTLLATGGTSASGLAAVVVKELRSRLDAKKIDPRVQIRGVQNESSNCRVTS